MNVQTKLLLAALAVTPVFSPAWAEPPATKINPGVIGSTPLTPPSDEVRRALFPAPGPAPTGPCMAELSLDRFEVALSADSLTYSTNVTISNRGTEAATGAQTNAGGVLGVSLAVSSRYAPRTNTFFAQMADINLIQPGASQTFNGSFPARELNTSSRSLSARINRGPDGPRCAYDRRANNDGLDVDVAVVKAWLAAGNASYVRVAPW